MSLVASPLFLPDDDGDDDGDVNKDDDDDDDLMMNLSCFPLTDGHLSGDGTLTQEYDASK